MRPPVELALTNRLPSPLRFIATKGLNVAWELLLNISTRGETFDTSIPDGRGYGTESYSVIRAILDHLALSPGDVVVDIGCGKGRFLCCAALRDVRRVIGVEADLELCELARRNVARLRGRRAPVVVHHALATDIDLDEGSVFYLFNTFGAATMEQWLAMLEASQRRAPRDIRLVYANPEEEAVLARCSWLGRQERWGFSRTGLPHDITFWYARGRR